MNIPINNTKNTTLNNSWAKAAIIGSTWAAIEIIAGSFLHNLKVPFAGTLLASIGVFLLVSYTKIWNEKGLIIKAALICALMKSISPSAIIIGPMIGIFMEGAILELALILIGRNIAGFIMGGGIAVLWSLVQKILYLLLMYGLDIVNLAKALYVYLIKVSGIGNLSSMVLIIGIASIYFLLGAVSAYTGYKVARQKSRQNSYKGKNNPKLTEHSLSIKPNSSQKHSIVFLISNIFAIISTLYLINHDNFIAASTIGSLFVVFCLYRYRNSTRHLRKPGLWIQFILITMIAIVLWEWASTGEYFSANGLTAGLKMVGRAIIVIFGFATIGTELRNPKITALLCNNKLHQLQEALTYAFATLPLIIETLPSPKNILSKRNEIIHTLLDQSETLLKDVEQNDSLHNHNRRN